MKVKVKDVEFEVEYELEHVMGGRIENLAVFLPNDADGQELSYVLEEKVLKEIEEAVYRNLPDGPEEDTSEDR